MAVGIFEDNTPDRRVSSGGTFFNPITFKFDNDGGVEERQLFLRHNILSGQGAESSLDVTIDPVDLATVGGDQSTWIQIAPDDDGVPGTYLADGEAWFAGNVNLGQVIPFWVKATVPANTENGARDDIALQLTSNTVSSGARPVEPEFGTFGPGTSLNTLQNGIDFNFTTVAGREYVTNWMDMSFASSIIGMKFTQVNPVSLVRVQSLYRMASDSAGTNPTAWFDNPAELDMTKDYLQVKLTASVLLPDLMWKASEDFSNKQGQNNWFYEYVSGGATTGYTLMQTYETANNRWSSSGFTNNLLWASGGHPQSNRDAVRTWVSPGVGEITVSSFGNVSTGSPYGTRVWISKNDSGYLWSTELINSSATVPPQTITVATNDRIHFGINMAAGGDTSDSTEFNAVVNFLVKETLTGIGVLYKGLQLENFDIRFWNGPATPEHISPLNGAVNFEFNPVLTAVSENADAMQFQLDKVTTFDSADLIMWEVPAENNVPVVTQSPSFDRTPGLWFWRARSKLDGVYGDWSDYWIIGINAMDPQNEFLYMWVSTGFEIIDPIIYPQFYYLWVNAGIEPDTIYRPRFYYLNVNVGLGIGEVIYPLFDKTPTRKQTFTEDGSAFV